MIATRILTPVLGAAALGLAAATYHAATEFSTKLDAPASTVTFALSPAEAAIATAKPGDAAGEAAVPAYAVIAARPVFSMTRRPPEPRPVVVQPAPAPVPVAPAALREPPVKTGQFKLVGVVIMNGEKRALVRNGREEELLRVAEGDEIDGWAVERIEPDTIRLMKRGVVDVVLLYDNKPRVESQPSRGGKKPAARPAARPGDKQAAKKPERPPAARKPDVRPAPQRVADQKRYHVAQDATRREARHVPVGVTIVGASRGGSN